MEKSFTGKEKAIELLCELVKEYHRNTNAAGEYDGTDPRLQFGGEDIMVNLAYSITK